MYLGQFRRVKCSTRIRRYRMSFIIADDGMVASEVGVWATEKHHYLAYYLDTCRGVRRKFIGPGNAGATYIDLFCGPGRARIRETNTWIDGSPIVAWKTSIQSGTPFSAIFIADIDDEAREACRNRLQQLNAPVVSVTGTAVDAARTIVRTLNPSGYNTAFVDPFSLGALDFEIIRSLAAMKSMDMILHLSAMDLRRNLDSNVGDQESDYDKFAPGWRNAVNTMSSQANTRAQIVDYWLSLIKELGVWPNSEMKYFTAKGNQGLYWLLIAAKHPLAQDFWEKAARSERQQTLNF